MKQIMFLAFLFISGCATNGFGLATYVQQSRIQSALANGKSVLIFETTSFNPITGLNWGPDSIRQSGRLRPSVTYWRNRKNNKEITIGDDGNNPNKPHMLTNTIKFYILEPGQYDLLGYAKKTDHLDSIYSLPYTKNQIKSSLGMVKFSTTTLPRLYSYEYLVPEREYVTPNGHFLSVWTQPAYIETGVGSEESNAVLVDMRGIKTHNEVGQPNIGSFSLEPGEITQIGDFGMDFTFGECGHTNASSAICSISTITVSPAIEDMHGETQNFMRQAGYSPDFISRVGTSEFIPGEFFKYSEIQPDINGHVSLRAFTEE